MSDISGTVPAGKNAFLLEFNRIGNVIINGINLLELSIRCCSQRACFLLEICVYETRAFQTWLTITHASVPDGCYLPILMNGGTVGEPFRGDVPCQQIGKQ